MLWNTVDKLILFHQVHFQFLVLTTIPNLKVNATATFQIICTLQRLTRAMMDSNICKPDQNVQKNQRYPRSTSSPSGKQGKRTVGPQRAQSQMFVGDHYENNVWPPYTCYNFAENFVHNGYNGFFHRQQSGGNNFHVGQNPNLIYANPCVCPVPSSSNMNYQYHDGQVSTTVQCSSSSTMEKVVPDRKWMSIKNIGHKDKKFVFTLMSYNVLAQDLVEGHEYLYKYHNKDALQWQVRWVNILKEIGDADPDIICFQEVQESHIGGYFALLEKKLGYKKYQKVEYFQEDIPVLNRDNVAIVARFIPIETNTQAFVVATTHLLYNPKRQDVRLAQVQSLMAEIDKMAFLGTNQNGTPSYLPIIVTGDLNATPDTAVYEFITNSVLDYENLSSRSLTKEYGKELTGKVLVPKSLQMTDNCQYAALVKQRNEVIKTCTRERGENMPGNCGQDIKFSSGTLSHPFYFKSAYNHISNKDIEGTTYQERWITVDYIFYSGKKKKGSTVEDKLKLISRYQLFTKKQLNGIKIPNCKLGSDHFSLIVKFSLE
ncbi:hypothetical protein HHI36_010217 [Cryptolaemus montrouzieri]|uniref:Endonuclease/exonuclease/phosphatase domain-containing protein n=1 Tax=Cryptolaemus montrouzieri TaxID=559131 RepID=A0ABD2MI38_9CUCU